MDGKVKQTGGKKMKANLKTKAVSLFLVMCLALSAAPVTVSAIGVVEQSQIKANARLDVFEQLEMEKRQEFAVAYGMYMLIGIVIDAGNNVEGNKYFLEPGALDGGDWLDFKAKYEREAGDALIPTHEFASATAEAYKATCEAAYRDYYNTLGGMCESLKRGDCAAALLLFGSVMWTVGEFTDRELDFFSALIGVDKADHFSDLYRPLAQYLMSGEPTEDFSAFEVFAGQIIDAFIIIEDTKSDAESYPQLYALFGGDMPFREFLDSAFSGYEKYFWAYVEEYAAALFAANDLGRKEIADALGNMEDNDMDSLDDDGFYFYLGYLLCYAGMEEFDALFAEYLIPLAEAFIAGDITAKEAAAAMEGFFVDGNGIKNREFFGILNAIAKTAGLNIPDAYLPQYLLTYDMNGYDAENMKVSVTAGLTFLAAGTTAFGASGVLFIEWNAEPDGTGIGYKPGDPITMPEHDLTLYAIWIWESGYYGARIIDFWVTDGMVNVEFDLADGETAVLAAASYGGNGEMLGVKYYSVNKDVKSAMLPIPTPEEEGTEIKVFLWDGLDGMRPLCETGWMIWDGGGFIAFD